MSKCGYFVDRLSILPRKTCSRLFTYVVDTGSDMFNAVYSTVSFHELGKHTAQVIHASKIAHLHLLCVNFSPVSTVPIITKIKD